MSAVVETSFFRTGNVGFFNSKLRRTADTNRTINWLWPKIQYDDKEMQHSQQPISNCASIQVELGLNIVEIDQHSKS